MVPLLVKEYLFKLKKLILIIIYLYWILLPYSMTLITAEYDPVFPPLLLETVNS